MSTTLVIIPTYNEVENLELVVQRVLASVPDAHVLIVDDNSPDGTGVLASNLALASDAVQVLHRRVKDGLGAAYRAGFSWGLERAYERFIEMDADGSHRPEQLPELLKGLETADVVVGSRWIAGGVIANWPWHRMVLSRGGSLYARLALGVPVRDITGGYRAFTQHALRTIDLAKVASQGYCFQIDMLWHAHTAGLRIAEVPITFVERAFGQSKMSSGIVLEAMLRVTGWGIRGLPSRLRGAIELPVSSTIAPVR